MRDGLPMRPGGPRVRNAPARARLAKRCEHFQRHPSAALDFLGRVDHAHAAAADSGGDAIRAEYEPVASSGRAVPPVARSRQLCAAGTTAQQMDGYGRNVTTRLVDGVAVETKQRLHLGADRRWYTVPT